MLTTKTEARTSLHSTASGTENATFAENATFLEILSRMSSMHSLDAEHSKITEKVAFSAKVHILMASAGAPAAGRAWEARQAPETEFLWRDQGL